MKTGCTKNQTGAEFLEVVQNDLKLFPLNFLFVTDSGDIAYQLTGMYPRRKYKVVHGCHVKKGWLKENQWEGLIYPKELPHVLNPKSGIIASANNFATKKNVKYGITFSFSFSTRALRIKEMLLEKVNRGEKLTVEDMMRIQ